MRTLYIFTFVIVTFLSVDALPYDKSKVHTIPLKPKSITRRRLFGTPQNFDTQFDAGSGDLFVFVKNRGSSACDDKPKYDSDIDTSFSPIDGKDFSVEYADSTEANGNLAKTTIVIADSSVEEQVINEISDDFEHPYEGITGMAFSVTSENEQSTPTIHESHK
ncbi:24467_t:CDS:1 [Gigaspora rosea]|nr:24467_t:CDS:1 [Gigaspora rosea]